MGTLKSISFDQAVSRYGIKIARHLDEECGVAISQGLTTSELLVGIRNQHPLTEVLVLDIPEKLQDQAWRECAPCGLSALRVLADNDLVPVHPYLQTIVEALREQDQEQAQQQEKMRAFLEVLEEEAPEMERIMRRLLEAVGEDPQDNELQVSGGRSPLGYELTVRSFNLEELGRLWAENASASEIKAKTADWLSEKFNRKQ